MKPDNFLISKQNDLVYIIDFGLAKRYQDPKTGNHVPYKKNKSITGTARYASINTHAGYEQSRRDDLESTFYSLIYLAQGSLPWQKAFGRTNKERYQQILRYKTSTSLDVLCKDLPGEFKRMVRYVRNLKFTEDPDYDCLIDTFASLIDFNEVTLFDWEILERESQHNKILAHFTATRSRRFSDVKDAEEEKEGNTKKRIELVRGRSLIDIKRKAIRQDSLQVRCSTHFRGEDNGQKQPQLVKV